MREKGVIQFWWKEVNGENVLYRVVRDDTITEYEYDDNGNEIGSKTYPNNGDE